MDSADRNNVCAVFLVEILKVRKMLEVVCINLAAVNNLVRLNIVREFLDVKSNVLFGKDFLDYGKNFGVRCG